MCLKYSVAVTLPPVLFGFVEINALFKLDGH